MAGKDEIEIDPKASESEKAKKATKKSSTDKGSSKDKKKSFLKKLDRHLVLRPKSSKIKKEDKPPLVKQAAKYKKLYREAKKEFGLGRKAKREEISKLAYERAEKYDKEYHKRRARIIRLKKEALLVKGFYVPNAPRLGFAIRIKGVHCVNPKIEKALEILRLRKLFNGTFLKLNKSILKNLKLVDPYVAWGYPSLRSVKKLLYQRGYGKFNKSILPLYSNELIEHYFKEKNIDVVCIEDIVYQIFTVGKYFTEVNRFLYPFRMSAPKGGIHKKRKHYIVSGQFGNREDLIDDLIYKMI